MVDPSLIEQDPRWTAVDTYAVSHLHSSPTAHPPPSVLSTALAHQESSNLPDIAVSPSQGKYLQLTARAIRAKNILEIGTLGGYSTIWLATSSPDAHVTSIEINEHNVSVARENLQMAGVHGRVDVRLGAGVDVLAQLGREVAAGKQGKFQFVFIDADKENNWNYVDAALGMCESGAVVIVDNVVRKGQLADLENRDSRVEGARRVVEMVGRDERLDACVVQIVGEKNYDGFLYAVVK
ncbi:O-methyltransferas-like protein family 3 [Plenodomus tracheiphilus IPT5]|uniref:O-methyltransferas-like protein family 3 n=1 Tax=Plenodomus tracheiphilus IPT5 TaxID=1408161 RepID=A0A6A7B0L0_9PLEO|nr:O-methyltransferas-like protein family 3 [Plenodomus tracheiphilus IPT5]